MTVMRCRQMRLRGDAYSDVVGVSYNDAVGLALQGAAEQEAFLEKALHEGWELVSEERLREDWSAIYQIQVPREEVPLLALPLSYPPLGISSNFAIDASVLVVAQPQKNSAQIYELEGAVWKEGKILDAGRKLGKWCFGTGVAICGELLAVNGAPNGAAASFLFEKQQGEWRLVCELGSPDPRVNPKVSIADGEVRLEAGGRASRYQRVDGVWKTGVVEAVGEKMLRQGSVAVLGDPFRYDGTGCVEIFKEVNGDWKLARELQLADCRFDDMFGACIAFHEERLLVAGRRRIHAFAVSEL